jgi:RNA polymerase sigma-70 factor (ECF subfamily)
MPPPPEQAEWFAEQVKPYEPLLRGYLQKRFPSLSDHDDIVQEAYSRLLRVGANRHFASVKGFLFTIARNVAIDTLRRQQAVTHEPLSEVAQMPLLHEAPELGETLERQQRHAVLIEAIASLPERCREVVMLRHLEGLSYKEIAERLGISPNTVKLHIVKGMKDCTAFFRAHGLLEMTTPSPTASDRDHPS